MKPKYINILLRLFFILIIGLVPLYSRAQALSPDARISILTFGAGHEELYSAFGHSAIRVMDPESGLDIAYNYGTFDFNKPNFYLNFAKGYLVYKLSVQDYERLKEFYEYYNRSITEQVLNLNDRQKQKVFAYLQNNAKPENADYFYDYFYDNCATKIGDVFVAALGEQFIFEETFVDDPGLTIRTLTDRYSAVNFPWGKLGIDLCLGMPMDKQLTNMQYTYLPDYVYKAFTKAKILNTGEWEPAVLKTNTIFAERPMLYPPPIFTPMLVFWLAWVVVLALTIFTSIKKISLRWLDFTLFLIIGFLGLFLFLLWTTTDHAAAAWNLNLLWAWPTHLFVGFWIIRKQRHRWTYWYMLAVIILGMILFLSWAFLPQALNYALIPIQLIIITRAIGYIME